MKAVHRCTRCRKTPDEVRFYIRRGRGIKYQNYCVECSKLHHKEKVLEYYVNRRNRKHQFEETDLPTLRATADVQR